MTRFPGILPDKIRSTLLAIPFMMIFSCKTPNPNENELQIYNGRTITESEFPYVVSLVNPFMKQQHCTGSFLTKNLLITASHCVYDETLPLTYKGKLIRRVFRSSIYKSVGDDSYDFALVQFDEDVAPAVTQLELSSAPSEKDELTAVGFGCNTPSESKEGRGEKRIASLSGMKVFPDTQHDGAILLKLSQQRPEQVVALCTGDSGGPLLLKDRIFGIASSGSLFRTQYAAVSTNFMRKFLGEANGLGAGVPNIAPIQNPTVVQVIDYAPTGDIPDNTVFEGSRTSTAGKILFEIRLHLKDGQVIEYRRGAGKSEWSESVTFRMEKMANIIALFYKDQPIPTKMASMAM